MATSMSPVTSTPVHPSSTLVNVVEDADIRLIRVLAQSTSSPSAFESTCSSCIASGDDAGLLRAVISQPGAIAGLLEDSFSVDECVSAFSLLAAILDRLGDEKLEKELVVALADAVGSDEGDDASKREKRSAMVAALFNLRSDGVEKTRLLARIVDMADTTALAPGGPKGLLTLADMLDSTSLQSTLALWGGVPDVDRRELYRAVVKAMDKVLAKLVKEGEVDKTTEKKIKAARERKQTYLLLTLETYEDEVRL